MPATRLTFGDVLRDHRRSYPDRVALVDGDTRLTWPELDDRVNRLANALRGAGVGQDDRVLWLGQNSSRVYELLGAAAKLGAMVCPGYWRWSPAEMAFAIDDFSPTVIIWQDTEIGETVRAARERATHQALWIQHDAAGPGTYEDFLASGDATDPDLEISPDSALLVIYTAAITGRQCGSLITQNNLISMGVSVAGVGDIDADAVFLNTGPMFHIGNFQFFGIPTFLVAGTNVVLRRVDAQEVLTVLEAEHVTHAYLMPATIAELIKLNEADEKDLSALHATFAGPLWNGVIKDDPSRFARYGGGIGQGYGQTELTGMQILRGFGLGGANAGRPNPLLQIRLLDADGNEVPDGEPGEICARGDVVHLGYWNRPEVNAERWAHGWWHTRDLGRREPDGSITFVGTLTRMIKSGAENIFPAEVEQALTRHPAVREAAVIGIPNERWLQDVKAVVVLADGATATEAELIEHVRGEIATYKKPKTIEFTEAIPRTAAGATDYEALDAAYGGGNYPGGTSLGAGR
ncbi:Acyl-CoA synthetase [Frankia canadensis]|uniref:Acyl-CoA synthetase n=1 Tax=Frankia canadensis TaxID=1836972 RepID=A0A2I2KNE6_9ACTN|nr:AMP-binding protein [Frankia canadensis]SNQ47176.1 Acyl-CoA synthetase [Frankia canadensis]SOU54466.1 Acyl-CoA synthetase [Frankia canadensis]